MNRALRISTTLLALAAVLAVALGQRRACSAGPGTDRAAASPRAAGDGAADLREPAGDLRAEDPDAGAGRVPEVPPAPPQEPDAALVGRLVDAQTGEPVPAFQFRLGRTRGDREALVSDADGRFTSARAYGAGKLRVWLEDLDPQPETWNSSDVFVEYDHDPGRAGRVDVPIEVGPTWPLDVLLPLGLGPRGFVVELWNDPPTAALVHGQAPPTTPLREPLLGKHGRPWARFQPRYSASRVPRGPWWIQVASRDGRFVGGARAFGREDVRADHGPIGVQPELRIVLEPRAALSGRYVDASGAPRWADLLLTRTDVEPPRVEHGYAREEHGFRFERLEPGAYRLEVRDHQLRADPVQVDVVLGDLDLGDLPATPIEIAGDVTVVLRSTSGTYAGPVDVTLVRTFDPPRHAYWHSADWIEEDGRMVARVLFEEVAAGTYDAVVHSHDLMHWEGVRVRCEPPSAAVEIVLDDPRSEVAVVAVEADTGARLDDWTFVAREHDGWTGLRGPDLVLEDVPLQRPVRWALEAPGYRPVLGTEAQLPRGAPGVRRELTVPLRPGWGTLVWVRRASDDAPVAGARVRVDGEPAGVTDAAGELWLEADAEPDRIEVVHPELVDYSNSTRDVTRFPYYVRLRPR